MSNKTEFAITKRHTGGHVLWLNKFQKSSTWSTKFNPDTLLIATRRAAHALIAYHGLGSCCEVVGREAKPCLSHAIAKLEYHLRTALKCSEEYSKEIIKHDAEEAVNGWSTIDRDNCERLVLEYDAEALSYKAALEVLS